MANGRRYVEVVVERWPKIDPNTDVWHRVVRTVMAHVEPAYAPFVQVYANGYWQGVRVDSGGRPYRIGAIVDDPAVVQGEIESLAAEYGLPVRVVDEGDYGRRVLVG